MKTMKTITMTIAATVLAASLFAGNGEGEKTSMKVNTEKSTIFWTGKKVTGEHTGTLKLDNGMVTIEDGKPVAAEMTLKMASIEVTDIEDPDTNGKLVGHLHSPDFFGTEAHPTGIFKSTSFAPIAGAKDREANYTVKGTLTLKGISQEIEFPVFVSTKGKKLVANGKMSIDRTKWDIKYGSGSFFDDLGDKVIYDDIELNFVLSAEA